MVTLPMRDNRGPVYIDRLFEVLRADIDFKSSSETLRSWSPRLQKICQVKKTVIVYLWHLINDKKRNQY